MENENPSVMNLYARLSLLQTFVMYLCCVIKFNSADHCLCRKRFVYDVFLLSSDEGGCYERAITLLFALIFLVSSYS